MACKKTYNPKTHYWLIASKLRNMKNDPQSFTNWLQELFLPDDADKIIDAIRDNRFDKNFGTKMIDTSSDLLEEVSFNGVPQSDENSESNFKARITDKIGNFAYENWIREFTRRIIELSVFNIRTRVSFNPNEIVEGNINSLNYNILNFKNELLDIIAQVTKGSYKLNINDSDETITKTIDRALSDFRSIPDNFSNMQAYKAYMFLDEFDSFITKTIKCVKLKGKYANSNEKGVDMYDWIGPTINLDGSWLSDETADINKYSSKLIKLLCDYIPEVKIDEDRKILLDAPLGFKEFNAAASRVISWATGWGDVSAPEDIRHEIRKGEKCDWGKIINAYKETFGTNDIFGRKLNALSEIVFGTNENGQNYLSKELRDAFAYQMNNMARTTWLVYRISRSDGMTMLESESLKDNFYNKQNVDIRNNIRSQIYYFGKQQKMFNDICKTYKIKIEQNAITFIGADPEADNNNSETALFSKDFVIGVEFNELLQKYTFNVDEKYDGKTYDSVLQSLAMELGIMSYFPDIYTDIINSSEAIKGRSLLDILLAPIVVTLIGSKLNENNGHMFSHFPDAGVKKNANGSQQTTGLFNLWQYKRDFDDLATFVGIIQGSEELSVSKNAEGNNLPNNQLKATINDAKNIIEDNINLSLNKIRSGIHNESRSSIFKDYDINRNPGIITGVSTRSDLMLNGQSKDPSQYTSDEVAGLSMIQDFFLNLIKENKVNLQTITHADKKTHFLIEYALNRVMIGDLNLADSLKIISGVPKDNYGIADVKKSLYDYIRKINANRTYNQIKEMTNRYFRVVDMLASINDDKNPFYKYQTELVKRGIVIYPIDNDQTFGYKAASDNMKMIDKFINMFESVEDLRRAFRLSGVDCIDDYDFIEWKNGLHANETIYNALELYCNPKDDSYYGAYCASCQNYDIQKLMDSGFAFSIDRDPSIRYIRSKLVGMRNWFNNTSGDMDLIHVSKNGKRVRIGLDNMNELIPTDISKITGEYEVELNPIYEAYYIADRILNQQFNDNIYGVVSGFEIKSAKKRNFDISFDDLNSDDIEKRNKARAFLKECEAERSLMQGKRTVIGGATRFNFNFGGKNTVSDVIKVAIKDDTVALSSNLSGSQSSEKVHDGSGWSSPIQAKLECNSSKDLAVGRDKKTIIGWNDPETGALQELKWAVFEITNKSRRDSGVDRSIDYETAFRKMHNFRIDPEFLRNHDLSKYYDPDGKSKGEYIINERIYKYDNNSGKNYALDKIEKVGNEYLAYWYESKENGVFDDESDPIIDRKVLTSLYDIDQFVGGAWTKTYDANADKIVYKDINVDLLTNIVCDLDLKDKFIAYLVNKSASKVAARNVNSTNCCNIDNKDDLNYFEMSLRYGGIQMNADHDLDESAVTEMSQVISALIQRGNCFNMVKMMYEDIGRVALEAIDKIKAANESTNNNDIFEAIGHALIDTFNAGNKNTIGLTQAFVSRFEQLLKSGKKNIKFTLPLSAETITPAFFATVGSMLNKRGIKRKYAGLGGYQCPSYNVMRHYNYGGSNMNYEEICNIVRAEMNKPGSKLTSIQQAFTDAMIVRDDDNNIFFDRSQVNIPEKLIPYYKMWLLRQKGMTGTFSKDRKYLLAQSYEIKNTKGETETILVGSVEDLTYFNEALKNHPDLLNPTWKSDNPFVKKINNKDELRQLWIEDTIVIVDRATGKITATKKLQDEDDLDDIKNYTDFSKYNIFNWTIRPKELISGKTDFTIAIDVNGATVNRTFTLHDLESIRASRYLSILADKGALRQITKDGWDVKDKMALIKRQIERLGIIKRVENGKQLGFVEEEKLNEILNNPIKNKKSIQSLQKAIVDLSRKDLNKLSRIKHGENISIPIQDSFFEGLNISDSEKNIKVVDVKKTAGQIVIGMKNKKQYLLQRGDTLNSMKNHKGGFAGFFEERLLTKYRPIDEVLYTGELSKIRKDRDIAIAYNKDGNLMVFVKNSSSIFDKVTENSDYTRDSNGTVWYKGEEELGEIKGAKFYKIKDTKIDFVVVGENNSLEDSIKEFKKSGFIEYDQISTGKGDEDSDTKEKYEAMIKRRAAQMAKSFIVQLNYIGARIPAQSMQSFMDLEVIDFIDSDINQVYVPRQLTWFQGSDFDIDKLYLLGFEVDNFGRIYMQTDLYKYSERFNFDYKDLLLLPMATGKDWEHLRKNGNTINQVDITGLIDKYNRNYYKVIKEILDNPNKYRNGFYTSDTSIYGHKDFVRNLYKLLSVHDSTKLEGSRKTGALKNVVAAKMLEVCKDASTQIDSHLPIEMDEARAAAAKNDGDAKIMTWNSSMMKFELQYQNMIGRTVIATVAVSLKSYFASLHSFQNRVAELQNDLKEKNLNIDVNTYDAINFINQLLDITFAGKNGEILTLTNIDFDGLKRELLNVLGDKENKIKIIKNGLNNKKGSGSENLDKYITNNPSDDSEAYFDIYRFVDDLDKASNKNYLTENNSGDLIWNGLDAALSLSGLLSAATDNAKELILVKLNATSEFADIYSAGLTTGMSFWEIADIMTSKAFNIVKKFSSQKIFDKNTKHFNIRNAINFVADKEDLNCLQKGVLDRLLTSKDILRLIFKEGSENGNFRQYPLVDFSGLIEGDGLLQAFNKEKEYLYPELSDNNNDGKYNDFIRNRILRELRYGKNAVILSNLIMNYLENKITTDAFKRAEEDDIASNFWFDEGEFEDGEFNDDLDDSYFDQSYTRKSIKNRVLTSSDYSDLYKYFKFYLNPKNEALRAIGNPTEVDNELNNIRSIFRLLDIADEMKINGRLCGINQGVKNNNIDEENFVEDINRFINKKYYDYTPAPGEKVDFVPFDLIRFTSDDEEYRELQIAQYEKVKAAINILKSVTSVGHFNAMLKFVNLNRSLITKATSMNFARHLATEALKDGQKGRNTRNGISYYMTKKFSANAFKTISRFSRDTLIINWLNSMSDSDAAFVAPKGEAMYNNKFQLVTAGKDYDLSLKTRQGILTFKRLMDYYIIPRLKKALGVKYINEDSSETKANEFLSRMKLYTYIDSKTNSIKSYTALDTRITNIEDNAALLKVYDNIVNDFKDIMNLPIGKINEGISNNDDKINFGDNWKIKDLFFMYNLIQNKDGFGRNSYTRIFEDLVSSGRQMDRINSYYEWLSNRDMQNGNYSGINYNIQNLRFQIALNNSDDAWKVNAQTGTSENGDNYIEMDGQRYTPKDHIPIDDTFDTIMDYFVVASKQNVEGFFDSRINVVPKETIVPQTIMEILKTKFGANANVEFFEPSPGSRYYDADGYVDSNGVIHINSKYEGAGDISRIMLHEYMHVICAALKFNSNTKGAYYELLDKIREKINNKENREPWLSKLIEDYTRMGVYGSALYEEILIKSIESAYKNSEVYEKLNKKEIKIPDIKNTLMELFNLNPENIEKENATAIKLANTSIQDVLELFSDNIKSLGIRPGTDWNQTVRMNAELIWLKKKVIERFKIEAKKGDIEFIGC